MTNDNRHALKVAHGMATQIQIFMNEGNMEMAHRASQIYTSILLTVLATELIPGTKKLWDALDKKATTPDIKGTLIQ